MKFYSNITIYFIIWLASILFISYLGFLTLPHSGNFSNDFFKSFSNWDGGHFLGIAKFGYSEKFQYAFFPLYPLIIKLISGVTQNYLLSSILISLVSAFLGIQLLYQLILSSYDKGLGEKVILGLLFFPTSFYFLTAYSEGLFFLLVVAAFYFLRQKKLILATVFASLASATRLVGLAVVLSLIVEVVVTSGFSRKNWFIFLAPVGFLVYCSFLYIKVSDPFYFTIAQLHWQRNLTVPALSFWETIKNLSQSGFINHNFNAFLDLIFAIFGIGLAFRSFRFLSPSMSIYFLTSILLPLFTPTLSSMPRFLLPIFPIFILLAFNKNKYINFAYPLISIMLLSIFSTMFVNGYWVS